MTADEERAVQQAAMSFLKRAWPMVQKDKPGYGLEPTDTPDTLKPGRPFELHALSDAHILAYREGERPEKYLERTGRWFVPLLAGNAPRALVEVIRSGDAQWKATAVGYAPLSRKWKAITDALGDPDGTNVRLIICYSVPGYFFTILSEPRQNLTSLEKVPPPDPNATGTQRTIPIDDASITLSNLKALLKERTTTGGPTK
jgi:hypothetical protein